MSLIEITVKMFLAVKLQVGYFKDSPATDFFVNVRTVIHIKWQSSWNLYPNNKLYKIYPNVSYTSFVT